MKKNIAVVGCGHWGKNLVRNFAELGSLSALCDPDLEVAKKLSSQYEVNNLSFVEILSDPAIEGVVLAVPAPLHASMAIKVMNAGKHAYVEKPLAMNNMEARKMIASAEENGVQLMVGHLLQYHPVFGKVRQMVSDGELGVLQYIYSNRLSLGKVRSEEDVIWSFAPHDISMILSLVSESISSVRTEADCILRPSIADNATIHLEFESGLKAHVAVSWIHPFKEQKLVIVGKKGMITFDDTQPWEKKLSLYKHQIGCENNLTTIEKADVEYIVVPYAEPLREECAYFMHLIAGKVAPLTDGNEGARVLEVLNAASSYLN